MRHPNICRTSLFNKDALFFMRKKFLNFLAGLVLFSSSLFWDHISFCLLNINYNCNCYSCMCFMCCILLSHVIFSAFVVKSWLQNIK